MAFAVKSKDTNLLWKLGNNEKKYVKKHISEWSLQGVHNIALFSFENIHEYHIEKIK